MRVSLNDLEKMQERNNREWHKKLLKESKNERKAYANIKKNIPEGYSFEKYIAELKAEIEAGD